MKVKTIALTISIFFCSIFCSLVVPYPVSNTYILTDEEQQYINDYNEDEETLTTSKVIVPILNLDWFAYMNSYFTKNVTIRVIDVYTLKEYYVQRLGGYNHADVQTIDAKNTAIFKDIYGGTWSWVRRPVWVEIEGKFYAGSSNGMPHGFDILQTGEGGHTCIHFLNTALM